MFCRRTCNLIRRFSSSKHSQDPYKVLGVKQDASTKQIKSAFYALSKKYHPDMNPDDPQTAADAFQKVVTAYETLGTEDRRQAYDSTMTPRYSGPHVYSGPSGRPRKEERQKQYEDIDIDYSDFLHFQQSNRRRRVFNQYKQMPNEFYEQFGGKKPGADDDYMYSNYKDSRAAQREADEIRLKQELEEMKKRDKHPLPSFEQLLRQQEATEREKKKKRTSIGVGIAAGLLIVFFGISHRH